MRDWQDLNNQIRFEMTLIDLRKYKDCEEKAELIKKLFLNFWLCLNFESLTEYNGFLTEV